MATENQLGRKLEKEKPQPPLFEGITAENEEARSSRGLCGPLEMGWWSILRDFQAPSLLLSVLEYYFVFCTLGDYSLVLNILLKYISIYDHTSNIF